MESEAERLARLRKEYAEVQKAREAAKPAKKKSASGWDTTPDAVPTKEELEAREKKRKIVAAAKARLLEIWTEAYTANNKDYARTVALVDVPAATKLPKGYRITREDTDTYLIFKVYNPDTTELLHLSIPKPNAPAHLGPHFTQGTYREDVKLTGGRKTRRSRPKQKRTRRVIRRLIRT